MKQHRPTILPQRPTLPEVPNTDSDEDAEEESLEKNQDSSSDDIPIENKKPSFTLNSKQTTAWKTTSVQETKLQNLSEFPSTDSLQQEKSALPPTASWFVFHFLLFNLRFHVY